MRNSDEAEELLTAVHTPGNAKFHQFLTPEQFDQRFGPNPADVAKVVAHFAKLGLAAQRSTSTTLTVTGSAAAFELSAIGNNLNQIARHLNTTGELRDWGELREALAMFQKGEAQHIAAASRVLDL